MNQPRYGRLVRAFAETPWAILPSKLAVIVEFVELRLEGQRLSDEEIRERIGAARPARQDNAITGGVAVIPIYGSIFPKANLVSSFSGGTSLELFSAALDEAVGDDRVGQILLDVDSPGGAVDLVPETAALIRAATAKKPVTAIANTMAASAAYWLAAQADELVVTPSGDVGSIGVFTVHDDLSGMLEAAGVDRSLIAAGKYKTEGNPWEPLSDEARQAIQADVDAYYAMFVNDVAKGRGVDADSVRNGFGQGRMVLARDAVRAGMADTVATFDETLARLSGGGKRNGRGRRSELAPAAALPNVGIAASTAAGGGLAELLDGFVDDVAEGRALTAALTGDRPEPSPAAAGDAAPVDTSAQAEQTSRATADSTPTARKENGSMFTSIEELVARQEEIRARQQEIDAEYPGQALPEDVRAEFRALDEEYDDLEERIKDIRSRQASIARKADQPQGTDREPRAPMTNAGRRVPENIWSLEDYRTRASSLDDLADLYTDGAKRAVELATFPHPRANREDAQAHIEQLLARHGKDGLVARRLLATGSPAYERAFGKMVMRQPLSGSEQQALSMYGLSIGSDADGGFAIPFTLDPTVVPTSNGAVNPWRALAAVKTITGNKWLGVSSDGVEIAYDAEGAEVDEGSPVLAQPEIDVEKAHLFIKYSIEVEGDWPSMRAELAKMIQDAKDRKEAEKFAKGAGHGSKEPQGLISGLGAGSIVDTATANTFALEDVDALDNELPPRFEPDGQMVANKALYNAIRALAGETFDIWMPLAEGIAKRPNGSTGRTLAGYLAWRCSEISSALTTGSEKVAVLGDFSYFVIVDRIGMTLEVVQHLVGENRRPTGERGLYGYFRNSSGILDDNAFRLLRIKHS